MEKVIDRRLEEAARLAKEQEVAGSTVRMIRLQEARERLVKGVEQDVAELLELGAPWRYVSPG